MVPVLTPRLAVLTAAAAVIALASPRPWATLLAVNTVLALATVVDWRRAPAARSIDLQRDAPAVITLGSTGTVTWTVRNTGTRPMRVALADELVGALGASTRRARMVVPAGGRARRGTP